MFVYGLLAGNDSGVGSGVSFHFNGGRFDEFGHRAAEWITRYLPIIITTGTIVTLIAIAYSVFVANIIEIGKDRYFTLCRYNKIEFSELFSGFRGGYYMSNVKTMFIMNLKIFLWSLLLIVPGIIKSLSWMMVPYILAENPNISTERAMEISEKATYGEKWEIFVLGLSFIGWYMLGALACGIGVIFVMPYSEATHAELYGALRYKAVHTGICSKNEIGAEL